MTKTNRKYYAWIGQNASCGAPHPITGQMSLYGTNYVFSSEKDRDDFVDEHSGYNDICIACTKRQLRGRNLGMSVRNFEEDLQHRLIVRCEDEDGDLSWDTIY